MRHTWPAVLVLIAAFSVGSPNPAVGQDIYGIRPGMSFTEAEATLEEVGERAAPEETATAREVREEGGIYRASFRVESGLLTIAASKVDATKKDFKSRDAARVQWISLTVPATEASGSTGAAKRVCERFRARWKEDLGVPSSDSLSGGALWRWEKTRLEARVLCLFSGEKSRTETPRTEILLLTEPILIS